jgi:hypothetical protein
LSQQWLSQDSLAAGPGPHTNFEQAMGLPNNFGTKGFPEISASALTWGGTLYQYAISGIISKLDENLTKTSGKHQFQFGGSLRHERYGYLENQGYDNVAFGAYATALENPSTNAASTYAAYANTGYADADMFLGTASAYTLHFQPPYIHFHTNEVDGYFQDNYRVSRTLTLNMGLRYEAHPSPWMKDGTIDGFDLKNDALVLGASADSLIAKGFTTQGIINNIVANGGKIETAQQAGQPSTLMDNYNLMFLPRFGFAWQPFGKLGTVVRGAYGRYLYPVPIYFSMVPSAQFVPFAGNYSQSYVSAGQSPDGFANYLMRSVPTVFAGVNSANVVNTNQINAMTPDLANPVFMDTHDAPDNVTQVNFTIEQPLKGNSAFRLSWVYAHDANLWNYYYFNNHPSQYVWEMQTGTTPPNGGPSTIGTNQYSGTATGPYDKVAWGGSLRMDQKTGWSTDNMLQANYQRLFHRGVAYQISYIWSKPMHTGGESGSDGYVYPSADYLYSAVSTMTPTYGPVYDPTLPPPQPAHTAPYAYYKALNKFEEYKIDTHFPLHEIRFNGVVDLPVGRNKRFLGNANRFVDELAGGWQVAGAGNIRSQSFAVGSSMWGPTNPLKVYKHKMPVTDCRSGACLKGYEWFNGYLPKTVISGDTCSAGQSTVVSGLSSNWVPYQTPIDYTGCSMPVNGKAVTDKYFGQNEVQITLPGKTPVDIGYNPGPNINPYSNTVLRGPFNWSADASLFKVFPIKEQVNLRMNVDAFNVFNVQGQGNPNGTDGIQTFQSSANTPRQIQLTLRLAF